MNKLKLRWSNSLQNGRKNFGDWVSPILCEALSGREVIHAKPNKCDLMAQGSILDEAKNHFWNRRIDIWGSGFIRAVRPLDSPHRIHAVRGWNSAALIRNQQIKVVGDPGLLCHILTPSSLAGQKEHPVGIIPHYVDQEDSTIGEFLAANPRVKLIDVFSEPLDFVRQVARCEVVLSSSLHGLITADALGVPNAWIRPSGKVWGNEFKFHDYYTIYGFSDVTPFPLTADTSLGGVLRIAESYLRPGLARIKAELARTFPFRR